MRKLKLNLAGIPSEYFCELLTLIYISIKKYVARIPNKRSSEFAINRPNKHIKDRLSSYVVYFYKE